MENIKIKRFNIYSCLSIECGGIQICFDPSKIQFEDLNKINPDAIFISHESMDHMDPCQVYLLQKRKNCPIFCSIACSIDLIQYFFYDNEFVNSINTVLPGSAFVRNNFFIETCKSIHCDYMFPLVFKVTFIKNNISIVHCFDTLLSDEIINFSRNTSLGIIPVGIAKGISSKTGFEFIQKMHSLKFVTNHFKSEQELNDLKQIVKNKKDCVFLDWNKEEIIQVDECPSITLKENYSVDVLNSKSLRQIVHNFNIIKTKLLSNKEFLDKLIDKYAHSNTSDKIIILVIFILISFVDSQLIKKSLIDKIKMDLLKKVDLQHNNLHTVILLFLGVYSQQSGEILLIDEVISLVSYNNEHITYWVVEYLGRCATSNKILCSNTIEKFLKIINTDSIYNSILIRRKIFWEIYRILKIMPSFSCKFIKILEKGLDDINPDVRLLSVLCFSLVDKICELKIFHIDAIFKLLLDEEDDVREISVKIIRNLYNKEYILSKKENILLLLNDSNCHVKNEAEITCKWLNL